MADRGISPRVSGTVDLGSASKAWRKLYLSDDGLAAMQNDFSSDAGAHNSIYRGKELPYTWAEIQAKVQAGDFSDLYIGDYKQITLTTNEKVTMKVAGINSPLWGNNPCVDFISKNILATHYVFNSTATNNGTANEKTPWKSSALYATLNDESTGIYSKLPSDLKSIILDKYLPIGERYSSGGAVTDDTGIAYVYVGKLWVPNDIEVFGYPIFGGTKYDATHGMTGQQYPIFRLDSSFVRKVTEGGASSQYWWLLSAVHGSSDRINSVSSIGQPYASLANDNTLCTVLCFRIGKPLS